MLNTANINTKRMMLIILAAALVLFATASLQASANAQNQSGPGGTGENIDKGKAEKKVLSDEKANKALKYWTKERMKNAKSLTPVLPGRPDSPPGEERTSEKALQPDGPAKTIPGSLPRHEAEGSFAQTQPTTADSPTPAYYSYPFPYTSGYVGLSYYSSYPNITFGKIFFVKAGTNYVCSGTVVNSENKSVVWTAGHCVHGGKGGVFNTNEIFVPDYKDGSAPFGRLAAKSLSTTSGWASSSNFSYDLGAIVVKPSSNGTRIANRVGSLGIGWNRAYQQYWKSTGYPAAYPFNGQRMYRCTAETATLDYSNGNPATMGIGCNMTGGASGGGWAIGLNANGGTVASVNSYKYNATQPNAMYGPYQGTAAANLYNSVRY